MFLWLCQRDTWKLFFLWSLSLSGQTFRNDSFVSLLAFGLLKIYSIVFYSFGDSITQLPYKYMEAYYYLWTPGLSWTCSYQLFLTYPDYLLCRGPKPQHKLLFPNSTGTETREIMRHSSHSNMGRASQASLIPEDLPAFIIQTPFISPGKPRWKLINILFSGDMGTPSHLQLSHQLGTHTSPRRSTY